MSTYPVKTNVNAMKAAYPIAPLHGALLVAGAAAALLFSILPAAANAQSSFEVTGWIPYWRSATGTADTLPHLDKLSEINPFVYTLRTDGTIVDNGSMDEDPWKSFTAQAKAKGVLVIPTIMSGDGATMHALLSNDASRAALVEQIAALVNEKGFDGIDIDFEGKRAETRQYFSAFLKELDQRLGNKWLMCTIETRLPHSEQYYGVEIPTGAGEYSNDLVEINKYCDRVRIMAYDQQGIDRKLSAEYEARGQLYAPVGDPAWIEKVVNHMAKDISKDKIVIGVPTYGYEYAVTAYANNQYDYDILWTFNPGYALPIAAQYNITPERAPWGEMAFAYVSSAAPIAPPSGGKFSALSAAAAASLYATQLNTNLTFRYLVWPDAQSVQTKIDLAKRLGVRGVALFKFDGGQDPNIWSTLAGVKQGTPTMTPSTGSSPSSPGSSAAPIARNISLGSRGEDVRTIQRILNASADTRVSASGAGSAGNETAYFGPASVAAIKKFQVKYGIAKAGVAGYGTVGPKTRAKLNQLIAS